MSAFQLADTSGEFQRSGRAEEAVSVAVFVLIPVVVYRRRIREERGGCAMDWDRERTESFGETRFVVNQLGLPTLLHASIMDQRNPKKRLEVRSRIFVLYPDLLSYCSGSTLRTCS